MSLLVHRRAGLEKRCPNWQGAQVVERPQRHHVVAAREVTDSGIGHRDVEVGVVVLTVEVGESIVVDTRLLGNAKGVDIQPEPERVLAILVEDPLARLTRSVVPRHVTPIVGQRRVEERVS